MIIKIHLTVWCSLEMYMLNICRKISSIISDESVESMQKFSNDAFRYDLKHGHGTYIESCYQLSIISDAKTDR